MIYAWDNGGEYSDHSITFIETELSPAAFLAVATKAQADGYIVMTAAVAHFERPGEKGTLWHFGWRLEEEELSNLSATARAEMLAGAEREWAEQESRWKERPPMRGVRERHDDYKARIRALLGAA